jgi:YVTN family beta-propeller protein
VGFVHVVRGRRWDVVAAALTLGVVGCDDAKLLGPRLYVASGFTDEVLQLDPDNGAVVTSISMDVRRAETDEPHAVAVDPNGRYWYATVAHGEPTLWKFELRGNRLVGRVRLGMAGAGRIGVTPGGDRAFVPDYYRSGGDVRSEVAVVRLADLEVIDRVRVCVAPHDAQVSPLGDVVAITCSKSDEIVVLDVATLEERTRFAVGPDAGLPGAPHYRPLNAVWSPSGERLFVTLHDVATVRAFAPDGEVLGSVTVGDGPAQIAQTGDGRRLTVANRRDGSVSVVLTAALAEEARIPLGVLHPHGVALSGDDSVAFVTYEGDTRSPGGVVAMDLRSRAVLWSAEAGAYTLGVAFAAGP